ncbi:MAG: cation:proton antiporter [Candidatus Spechtbacterales bacterium]|nr:cation:proton antiporter [Candidatus Spechtbacterales bacterium]
MATGIIELAIIVIVAAVLGIIMHFFRQPAFLAYIFTGVALGAFGLIHAHNMELFEAFSSLGIMFLLFLIGMEINYDSLRLVGKTSLVLGIGQILFTSAGGFLISIMFGFSVLASVYIAVALTFSSTIIIVKLLSERKQIHSLHGKISIGFLLVQDFVAMLILMVLAGMETGEGVTYLSVGLALLKGIGLFLLMLYLGRKVIPPILDKIAQSLELLFLTSLAWALGVAAAVSYAGFSVEIGGFLAGLALANSSEHFQISGRIRSLRDFFILIFFVTLGSSLVFSEIASLALPIIIFSLFVLVGNPIIVMVLMGFMGYRRKTSFMSGLTVAQISEFSLIVVTLGLSIGHVSEGVLSLVTAVGITTIIISTYLITYSENIFEKIKNSLGVFEKKNVQEKKLPKGLLKPVVLIGGHRIGQNIASQLPRGEVLVVDFDPELTDYLKEQGLPVLFGDISDEEIQEQAGLEQAEIIISTSPDFITNEALLHKAKEYDNKPLVVVRAETIQDAKHLYNSDADYVILPHLTAGQSLGHMLAGDRDKEMLTKLRKKDMLQMESSILKH